MPTFQPSRQETGPSPPKHNNRPRHPPQSLTPATMPYRRLSVCVWGGGEGGEGEGSGEIGGGGGGGVCARGGGGGYCNRSSSRQSNKDRT